MQVEGDAKLLKSDHISRSENGEERIYWKIASGIISLRSWELNKYYATMLSMLVAHLPLS
jgi:hypothetical protein